MYVTPQDQPSAEDLHVGLAVSRYHREITTELRTAAVDVFARCGGRLEHLVEVEVPGAFELTAACRALAMRAPMDAVVALGCVVSGETRHDRYIARAVATGLTSITVQTGVPVAFGLLTCASLEQARARAGGAVGNKGAEAMTAALETAHAVRAVQPKATRS